MTLTTDVISGCGLSIVTVAPLRSPPIKTASNLFIVSFSFHNFDFAPGKEFVQKKSHRRRRSGTNGARLCRGDQPQHERTSRCRLFLSRVPISRAAALCYWWHRPPACCFRRRAGNRLQRRLFFQRPPTRMPRLPAKFGGTPNLTGATPVPPKNTPAAAA